MIDSISISEGKPVIYLPLACVLLISALKDIFEDLRDIDLTVKKIIERQNAIGQTKIIKCNGLKLNGKI